MNKLLIILCFSLLPCLLSYQNSSVCTGNNFFDTSMMNCEACPANQTANSTQCYCNANYIIADPNQIGFQGTCQACPTNSAPSSDGYTCIQCPTTVDPRTGDCLCPDGNAVIDIDQNGTQLQTKACVPCATDAYPGPLTNVSIKACKTCGYGKKYNQANTPWTCDCDTTQFTTAGDTCVLTSAVSNLNVDSTVFSMSYTLEDGTTYTVTSSTVTYLFYKAVIGCINYKDAKSCQTFANLCVMQLYSERNKICTLYEQYKLSNGNTATNDYNNYYGWHYNYPWLYYENSGDAILKDTSFTETISFDSNSKYHYLEFYVFKYTIDGTFKGSELLQTQFQLCPHSFSDGLSFRSFGISFENNCELDISNFFDRNENQMLFYDVYLKDRLTQKYIPVPILLKNFVDTRTQTPNTGSDTANYRFVRRFFMYDNLGGVENNNQYINGGSPSVVRYAKSIVFKTLLQDNKDQKIFVPYITVEYSAQRSSFLSTTSITFSTNYEFDTSNFFYTIEILFILTNLAIGFIWVLRVHIWTKYNPSKISPENYTIWIIIKALVLLIDTWGYIIFLFLFVITGYWFIFFKIQKNVFIFMPPLYTYSTNYYPFICTFAVMCSFRIFSMLEMIWRQGSIDIFFIDWENPKMILKKKDYESEESISIWRSLFIANEFNELQPYRVVSTEWTLIFLAFFLRGVNWENLAAVQPYMTLDAGNVQSNFVLKYFLTVFLFLVIGLIQIVGKRLLNIWTPNAVQDFVDLCSVANVSLFILDETLHGYYIHGKAPGGTAEINAEELELALEAESKGNARSRGLEINDPLQSYEMFIPWEMRVEYKGNYQIPLDGEVSYNNNIRRNADAFGVMIPKALPPGMNFKFIEEKKKTLSRLLKEYIENVVSEKEKYIKNKTYFQRFFDYPPTNMDTLEGCPIFLRDPDLNFQKIFFCGNEFSLLLIDISIYEMWDIIFGNTLVAIIMTYITIRSLVYFRLWLGERNISKKTLINQRFLI